MPGTAEAEGGEKMEMFDSVREFYDPAIWRVCFQSGSYAFRQQSDT